MTPRTQTATLEEIDFEGGHTRLAFRAAHGTRWAAGEYVLTPVTNALGAAAANTRPPDELWERVAWAICKGQRLDPDERTGGGAYRWEAFKQEARDAIEELMRLGLTGHGKRP